MNKNSFLLKVKQSEVMLILWVKAEAIYHKGYFTSLEDKVHLLLKHEGLMIVICYS